MPVHTEAENIAIRQTVRGRPNEPSPVELERYPWLRYEKLELGETGPQLPPPTPPPGVREIIAVRTPLYIAHNFFIRLRVAAPAIWDFAMTPTLTGQYRINEISCHAQFVPTIPTYWGMALGGFVPANYAAWQTMRQIMPTPQWVGLPDELIWQSAGTYHTYPVQETVTLNDEGLVFVIYTALAPMFIETYGFNVSLTESP